MIRRNLSKLRMGLFKRGSRYSYQRTLYLPGKEHFKQILKTTKHKGKVTSGLIEVRPKTKGKLGNQISVLSFQVIGKNTTEKRNFMKDGSLFIGGVDSYLKNKGLLSQMLAELEHFAKTEIGSRDIYLEVRQDNENAIKRYKHLGFKFTKHEFGNSTFKLMRKTISST
jgi:ribosomal protein S18 acetylase RimI-like enzyme